MSTKYNTTGTLPVYTNEALLPCSVQVKGFIDNTAEIGPRLNERLWLSRTLHVLLRSAGNAIVEPCYNSGDVQS